MPVGFSPCFSATSFNDGLQEATVTFGSNDSNYLFSFPVGTDYTAFKAAPNGGNFNANVRDTGVMTFTRLD